jgi:anthranilate synthase component 2
MIVEKLQHIELQYVAIFFPEALKYIRLFNQRIELIGVGSGGRRGFVMENNACALNKAEFALIYSRSVEIQGVYMIVMIDNYDSFTYNVVQYLSELGAPPKVFRNDKTTVDELLAMKPDALVVSPGPCTPKEAGISREAIRRFSEKGVPILGICLGHQSIGDVFGAKVVHAPYLMHGKVSDIEHDASGVFDGLPNPFKATRYHSLTLEPESLPECLEVNAKTEDGVIMGIRHKTLPVHGVQFHPESIITEHGHALLKNFLKLSGQS